MNDFKAFLDQLNVPDLKIDPLDYVFKHETLLDGLIIECGVFKGKSTRRIAERYPDRRIYGFDSFEGLPESWNRPDNKSFVAGKFNMNKTFPKVPANVTLIMGWFDKTLPEFVKKHAPVNTKISLLHVDCDIYSSTRCVLDSLKNCFTPGTIIVFDEIFNYPTFEKHELKALYEFLQEGFFGIEWIGQNGSIDRAPVKAGDSLCGALRLT